MKNVSMTTIEEIKQALLDDILQRFWKKIEKSEGCWKWKACIHSNGYGGFTILRKEMPPHRLSWILHKGSIPKDHWVLHKCDNRTCSNPEHLFLGDVRDNVSDSIAKGRHTKGIVQGLHKVTEEQVKEIRKKYMPYSYSMYTLAKEYGISVSEIHTIVHRKTWKHIT